MNQKEFFINDNDIRLHAKLDFPAGVKPETDKLPLVIIIHGFTGHMEEDHLLAVVDAANELGFATLRAEMYGHGGSDGLFEDHTLERWISNANAVTDYAKSLDWVTDLYLAGHSQGGLLTVLTAGLRPQDFKAIMPLSPALMIPEGARTGDLLATPFDPNRLPKYIVSPDWKLKSTYISSAQKIYVDPAITAYTGPVLIVHGDADLTVPVENAITAAEKYADCTLKLIPGDTHCFDYHLDQMKAAVKEYLQQFAPENS